VWARLTLTVGLVLAGTLLSSMLLTATGIGAEARSRGEHGTSSTTAMEPGGDRGHERGSGDGGHDRPPGEASDHSGQSCP